MKTLYLCAAGNAEGIRLAVTVNRHHRLWDDIVVLDDNAALHGTSKVGVVVRGPFSLLGEATAGGSDVVNLVSRTTKRRDMAMEKIAAYGHPFVSLVHPGIDLLSTGVGAAVAIYQNVTIGAESSVGDQSVILPGAVVGHGSRVGRNCVIAPNAVVNARVVMDEGVYLGSNASILPDVHIGQGATIGAGSVVYSDVPAGATCLGVPAEILAIEEHRSQVLTPGPATGASRHAVSDEVLGAVRGIVQEVLNIGESFPANVSFFDLGGDSLSMFRIRDKVHKTMGADISITDLYRFPTVDALSLFVARQRSPIPTASGATDRGELRRRALTGRGRSRQ